MGHPVGDFYKPVTKEGEMAGAIWQAIHDHEVQEQYERTMRKVLEEEERRKNKQ